MAVGELRGTSSSLASSEDVVEPGVISPPDNRSATVGNDTGRLIARRGHPRLLTHVGFARRGE